MQIHNLKPIHKRYSGKRIGRGGKRGTTSGRGTKGQSSRSGSKKIRPAIYDLIKKLPKLRGWKMKVKSPKPIIISISKINKIFNSGDLINKKNLVSSGLVKKMKSQDKNIKILGKGKVDKKIIIDGLAVSKGVKESVLKAGGHIQP